MSKQEYMKLLSPMMGGILANPNNNFSRLTASLSEQISEAFEVMEKLSEKFAEYDAQAEREREANQWARKRKERPSWKDKPGGRTWSERHIQLLCQRSSLSRIRDRAEPDRFAGRDLAHRHELQLSRKSNELPPHIELWNHLMKTQNPSNANPTGKPKQRRRTNYNTGGV
jgi:hypothetical protein